MFLKKPISPELLEEAVEAMLEHVKEYCVDQKNLNTIFVPNTKIVEPETFLTNAVSVVSIPLSVARTSIDVRAHGLVSVLQCLSCLSNRISSVGSLAALSMLNEGLSLSMPLSTPSLQRSSAVQVASVLDDRVMRKKLKQILAKAGR